MTVNITVTTPTASVAVTGGDVSVRARALARHTTFRVSAGTTTAVAGVTLARHTPSHL